MRLPPSGRPGELSGHSQQYNDTAATLALPDLPFFSSRCRFPGCDPQGLIISAERLRGVIAESPINNTSGPIPVTISVGLVSVGAGNLKPVEHIALVQAADSALYRAKAKGRNPRRDR